MGTSCKRKFESVDEVGLPITNNSYKRKFECVDEIALPVTKLRRGNIHAEFETLPDAPNEDETFSTEYDTLPDAPTEVETLPAEAETLPTTEATLTEPVRLALRAYLNADKPGIAHEYLTNYGITLTDEQLNSYISVRENRIWDYNMERRGPFKPGKVYDFQSVKPKSSLGWDLCAKAWDWFMYATFLYRQWVVVDKVCGPYVRPGLVLVGEKLIRYAYGL